MAENRVTREMVEYVYSSNASRVASEYVESAYVPVVNTRVASEHVEVAYQPAVTTRVAAEYVEVAYLPPYAQVSQVQAEVLRQETPDQSRKVSQVEAEVLIHTVSGTARRISGVFAEVLVAPPNTGGSYLERWPMRGTRRGIFSP